MKTWISIGTLRKRAIWLNILSSACVVVSVTGLYLSGFVKLSEPRASWSAATGIPRVEFVSEWPTEIPTSSIAWSADEFKILTLSLYGGRLTLQNPAGKVEQEIKLPVPFAYHLVINPQKIVMIGDIRTRTAFVVIDIASGQTIFHEQIPQSGEPGRAQAALHFALSQDGSTFAAAYGGFLPGQPVTLYDARDWHKLLTIDVPAARLSGVGPLAFSRDASRLAFTVPGSVRVVDVRTGALIRAISIEAGAIELSPDGDLMAVNAVDAKKGEPTVFTRVRIFRLSDGSEVTSHAPPHIAANCPNDDDPEACGLSSPVLWDPKGRFLIFPDGYRTIRMWNPFGGKAEDVMIQIRYFSGGIALSPDGTRLAIGNGNFVSIFRIGD